MVASTLLPTTGNSILDGIIAAGAVVGALALIWRSVIRPTARAFSRIDEYGPVLEDIAKQFKSDSGSTLKDTLNRLEKAAKDNQQSIEAAKALALVESATLGRLEVALGVLEGRLTGDQRDKQT